MSAKKPNTPTGGRKPRKRVSKKAAKKKVARKAPQKVAKKKVAKKAARKVAKKTGKSKGGRPSAYKAEYAEQVEKLTRLGMVDREIADFFGVSEVTINAWKKYHPEFLKSLKEGKFHADAEVADSLFKRATGYSHKDTKFATHEGKITDHKEYTKHYAPDTVACIFWLKNRRPDLWRDKVTQELTGPNGGPIQQQSDYKVTEQDEAVIKRIAAKREEIKKKG